MITKLFVTRPTLAAVLVALAAIGGGLAAYSMRVQELPDIVPPLADVIIFYPAASPAEMRDGIVRPIEDQIAGAPHLDHIFGIIEESANGHRFGGKAEFHDAFWVAKIGRAHV